MKLLDVLRVLLLNASYADDDFTEGRYADMKVRMQIIKGQAEVAINILDKENLNERNTFPR